MHFAYSYAAYYCELIWKFHFYTLLLVFHRCLPACGCIYPSWPFHLWPFLPEDVLSCLTLSCVVLCIPSFTCPQSVLFSHSSSRVFCKISVGLAFIICSVDSGGGSNLTFQRGYLVCVVFLYFDVETVYIWHFLFLMQSCEPLFVYL